MKPGNKLNHIHSHFSHRSLLVFPLLLLLLTLLHLLCIKRRATNKAEEEGEGEWNHCTFLPTTIITTTLRRMTVATITIPTTMIETGTRTMVIRGTPGTEHRLLLASTKLTVTTGLATTTPDLTIAEQGMIIHTIQITLMMLDMVGMDQLTAMTTITTWEEE